MMSIPSSCQVTFIEIYDYCTFGLVRDGIISGVLQIRTKQLLNANVLYANQHEGYCQKSSRLLIC